MNEKLLNYFDKQIKLKYKLKKLKVEYNRKIRKIEKKINDIENNIIDIQEEIINKNDIEKELEEMITNSVKSKNAKIIIPIQNESLYMVCLNSNNFNICYDGDMRKTISEIIYNIEKIDEKYIYLELDFLYHSKLRKVLIKHFIKNENINKDIFLKFLEFLKEYIKIKKKLFLPDIKKINKKIFINIEETTNINDLTKRKYFVNIIGDCKNKFTPKQKEIIINYIKKINEQQKTIKDLMKRIKEFNIPAKIIKQLTK